MFLFPEVTLTSAIFAKIREKKKIFILNMELHIVQSSRNISVKRSVFSDVTYYSLINIYQHFGGNLCMLREDSTLKMVAVTVKMKKVGTSDLFVMIYPIARRHIMEAINLRHHSRENILLRLRSSEIFEKFYQSTRCHIPE